MNKMNWKFFKVVTLILVIFVSGLALYIHQESADFDPIKEIQRLKSEDRRDDALDMIKFFKENEQANPDEIKALDIDLEYSTAEKFNLSSGTVYLKGKSMTNRNINSNCPWNRRWMIRLKPLKVSTASFNLKNRNARRSNGRDHRKWATPCFI